MINSFSGRYAFLSNFFLDSDGFCAEVEFQACKATCTADRDYVLGAYKGFTVREIPREAKRRGRKITLRHDWEKIKLEAMQATLQRKFSSIVMKEMLLQTDDVPLIEGNWWHDVYWGVCDGSMRVKKCPGHPPYGENNLGKLLMVVRSELR